MKTSRVSPGAKLVGLLHTKGQKAPTMLTASQSRGPAPLPVTFDVFKDSKILTPPVNGSGDPDTSRWYYAWNFGDGSATWAYSLRNKNIGRSCQEFHTYETPGIYIATLTILTDTGVMYTYTQKITVTVFPVTWVRYVDNTKSNGNDGLTPATAWQTVTFGLDAMEAAGNGDRQLLLKAAQTHDVGAASNAFAALTGNYLITKYGAGANPIITKTGANPVHSCASTTYGVRWVDIDLSLDGVANGANASSGFIPGRQGLYLRCTINNPGSGFTTTDTFGGKFETILQDCTVVAARQYGVYWNYGYRVAIGGCSFEVNNGSVEEHNCRCYFTHSSVKHNKFIGGRSGKHHLKFTGFFPTGDSGRNGMLTTAPFVPTETAEYNVISDNWSDASQPTGMSFIFAFGPQDSLKDQRVQNCIMERNFLRVSSGSAITRMMACWTRWCCYRNNLLDGSASGTPNIDGINITRRGLEPRPEGNVIVHNSFFHATASMDSVMIANVPTALNNGTFTGSATFWTLDAAAFAYGTNNITVLLGTGGNMKQLNADQNTPLVIGRSYLVQFTLTAGWAGTLTPKCGSTGVGTARSAAGTYSETIVCAGSNDFIFTSDALAVGTLDTVTCQEQSQPLSTIIENNFAMCPSGVVVSLPTGDTTTVQLNNLRSAVGLLNPGSGTPGQWTPDPANPAAIDAGIDTGYAYDDYGQYNAVLGLYESKAIPSLTPDLGAVQS